MYCCFRLKLSVNLSVLVTFALELSVRSGFIGFDTLSMITYHRWIQKMCDIGTLPIKNSTIGICENSNFKQQTQFYWKRMNKPRSFFMPDKNCCGGLHQELFSDMSLFLMLSHFPSSHPQFVEIPFVSQQYNKIASFWQNRHYYQLYFPPKRFEYHLHQKIFLSLKKKNKTF